MDCPFCSFAIPPECRYDMDYSCPTCREAFRLDMKARPGRKIRRSGPRPDNGLRPIPSDTENFREWLYRVTS